MLDAKKSAGVAPEVDLRDPSHVVMKPASEGSNLVLKLSRCYGKELYPQKILKDLNNFSLTA